MLRTNLKHLESETELNNFISENENAMVCCGRMGPMCLPVYDVMEKLEKSYESVAFADMEFDIPDASAIRNLPECSSFMGLPFTIYYKNGKVVAATSSIQNENQVKEHLDQNF